MLRLSLLTAEDRVVLGSMGIIFVGIVLGAVLGGAFVGAGLLFGSVFWYSLLGR